MSSSSLSLKLFIDQETNKVLFAEAGKETIDFLFSILTLPIARVISLLSKPAMVGCLANLYESVESLKEEYLENDLLKDALLKPKAHAYFQGSLFYLSNPIKPKPKKKKPQIKLYRCVTKIRNKKINTDKNYGWTEFDHIPHCVSDSPWTSCPTCLDVTNIEVPFIATRNEEFDFKVGDAFGGFVKRVAMFMVTDDLVVKPMSTSSTIALLTKLNVKDVEEKVVYLDINKGLMLLKEAFQTKNVLTSVFLPRENPSTVDA